MRCGSDKQQQPKTKRKLSQRKVITEDRKKHGKTINDIYSINSTPHQKEPEVSPEAASTNRREGKTKVQLQCVQWRCKSASILLCGVLLATLQCHGELYVHSYLQRCKSASILLLGIDIVWLAALQCHVSWGFPVHELVLHRCNEIGLTELSPSLKKKNVFWVVSLEKHWTRYEQKDSQTTLTAAKTSYELRLEPVIAWLNY